jgi:hypothetical protein
MYRLPDELVNEVRFVRPLNPYKIGDRVSGDEFRTWPETNRRAIIDQGYVELIGGQPAEAMAALDQGALVRVVVPRSDTLFDVVEGRKINEQPMTDEAATLLADALPVGMPEDRPPSLIEADHDPAPTEQPAETKRIGGRPKGSKNKAKPEKPAKKPKSKPKRKREAPVDTPQIAAE